MSNNNNIFGYLTWKSYLIGNNATVDGENLPLI